MVKFWLTKKERRYKWKEAKRGWGTTKDLTPLEYVAWRDRRRRTKLEKEKEEHKKRDQESKKKWSMKKGIEAKRAKSTTGVEEPKKKGSRLKYIIIVLIVLVIIYLVLKYVMNVS
ncbi:hypothetical protein ACFL96_09305 [Thermoproteota archaeon]